MKTLDATAKIVSCHDLFTKLTRHLRTIGIFTPVSPCVVDHLVEEKFEILPSKKECVKGSHKTFFYKLVEKRETSEQQSSLFSDSESSQDFSLNFVKFE